MAMTKWLAVGSLVAFTSLGVAEENAAGPLLTQFVRTAVDNHPGVRARKSALDASGARRNAEARPLYNPELSLDAENSDAQTRTIGLSQTFDWGGKRRARTSIAASERRVAETALIATRWQVSGELLAGLARHQTGQARDQLASERVRVMSEFEALAARRFEAGDLTQVEFDLASLAATDARLKQATVLAELADARQTVLAQAPTSTPASWPSLPEQLPNPNALGEDPRQRVLKLPNVQLAQRQVDTAAGMVDLRRRERRPDPTLSLSGGKEDDDTLVGLRLSIPLPVRNRYNHEVTAAIAEQSQAQALADDVMRRAYARLVSATERYRLSNSAWSDWAQRGRTRLSRQGAQLQRLWEAGELSTTDYLVQVRQTIDVQDSALDVRLALWRAWFEWLEASGQMDAWLAR